ncbi:MAG: hypothetical protein Q4F72_08920, partial [Desulfovibrionaceae bacterium]|nr:hypothetical protein [Desulfovibrionaceae bacterium]
MAYILRFFKFVGILCLFALAVLFFQFNGFAMQFAESWTAGTGWIVFLVLTGVEVLGFVLLFLAWYPKRSKLILRSNPTPEQMDAFAGEMRRRLRENELVRAGGVSTSDPEFV